MDFQRLSTPQRVSGVAMAVVAVAAFLPWVSLFGISKIGISGDGSVTLVLAIVGAAVLAFSAGVVGGNRSPGKGSQITLLILATVVAIIALADMNGVAAIGLYLTLLGGIAWVVGAVWELSVKRTATDKAQSAEVDASR